MASSSNTPSAVPAVGSVSFKAYLMQRGSEKPKEVRRFGMEQNEVTGFDLLKKKIRLVFPSLANQEFTISWKDCEDDDIMISSNEELLTALTETTEQVRRLYLVPKNPLSVNFQSCFAAKPLSDIVAEISIPVDIPTDAAANDSGEEEDEGIILTPPGCKRPWRSVLRGGLSTVHPNVYCDGCNKSIAGHRYKCLECGNFDLCPNCESKGMHSEHVMLRIPITHSHYTMLHHFSKAMHLMSDALHKIDNRCKKHERRMHKIYEGNMKRCDDFMGLADDMIHVSKRCKRDYKDCNKDKRERKEQGAPTSCNAGTSAGTSASSAEQQQPSDGGSQGGCPFPAGIVNSFLKSPTISNLLNPQTLTTLQQMFEQMSAVPDELLQEVAQNLADVRLNDIPAPDASSTSAPSTAAVNPFTVNAKKTAATVPDADVAFPSTSSTPQVAASASAPAEKDLQPVDNQQTVASATDGPTPTRSASRSSSEENDAEGWMVVDSQIKDGNAEQGQVYPRLPVVEPTPQPAVVPVVPQLVPPQIQMPVHRDPEVQRCLNALAEMGYDAHQQPIIGLAEEYKGNLSRVLNILLS